MWVVAKMLARASRALRPGTIVLAACWSPAVAGAVFTGAADEKNLFLGVGGMGKLPGIPAVGGLYGGAFSCCVFTGAADEKNLFLGVGGMGKLPGIPAVGGLYGGAFSHNSSRIFSDVTYPLGGVGNGVRRNLTVARIGDADGIPSNGISSGGTLFGGVGGGARRYGAGVSIPSSYLGRAW